MAASSSSTSATAEGLTQVAFHEDADAAVHIRAGEVRPEYVIAVEGKVTLRGARRSESQSGHRRSGDRGVEGVGF